MHAEIITIGDEILIGQIVDTNSAYIATELSKIGVQVVQITSVQDDKKHILESLSNAEKRAEIVLLTGGLGPTKDDITKNTLCEYFEDQLVLNEKALKNVKYLFEKHLNRTPNKQNLLQAQLPSKAIALENKFGTAPGMWLEKNNTVFVSMPGVPYEMKSLMQNEVLPRLQKKFKRPVIVHKTLLTTGMGESAIAEIIEEFENNLPQEIKLAYLPSLGRVRLRLSTKGLNEAALHAAIDNHVKQLQGLIGDIIIGFDEETSIEEVIANLLVKNHQTLSLAESCTGGQMARKLTKMSGSSQYFTGGFVTYATASKTKILGVPKELIKKHTVVSSEVAEAMAKSAKQLYETDFAISTTGIAGPTKGDANEDVGTVFIGIATPQGVFSEKFNFGKERQRVITSATNKGFELLRKEILKN
ncbi:competence/damage-inducible protein A [Planktosalinus lacus]|uniref:CinA-like protein n=1 Tax=Planktosalinus lacus TaxID=1526573 RepID=A0A8J2VEX5_9FLAO|nr:competence/damage-inducible protein A [Planktosalinus lacus]GGE01027.1 CinA-like protein [Planktosalinus lacus]